MKQSNKRKRLRGSKKKGLASESKAQDGAQVEQRIPNDVLEAFKSVSLDDGASVSGDCCKDSHKSGSTNTSSVGSFDFTSSSSSNTSEAVIDANCSLQDKALRKSKPKMKKVVATAGTVSSFLGKDYVRSIPKRDSLKMKNEENLNKEEAEQFLYSVLGDDTHLSFAVVTDVFCQCGYNLDKALDVLLELSSSSAACSGSYKELVGGELDESLNFNLSDKSSSSSYNSSDVELQGNSSLIGKVFSNVSMWPQSGNGQTSNFTGSSEVELSQTLLNSLYGVPTLKTSERDPETMDWKTVVKKIKSLRKGFEPVECDSDKLKNGKEYQVLRESANHHYDSMKSYYKRATTAFGNGNKAHAAYLSEQGREQKKIAREADEKCSQDIFQFRNKGIQNMITIDLHGQHVKQAMKLLKLHLLFGAYVRSVRSFRVITGCGMGKSTLKNAVIGLLKREGISCSEENKGSLLIRLGEKTSFGFLETDSDSD